MCVPVYQRGPELGIRWSQPDDGTRRLPASLFTALPFFLVFSLFGGLCPYSRESTDLRISPYSIEKRNSEKPVGHASPLYTAIAMGPFYFNEPK